MRWLWWLAPLAACSLLLLPLACSKAPDPWAGEVVEKRVVVTVPPLYSFVRGVAGDRAAIKCLCTTTGPHDYQTDFRDSRLMDTADVVFAVGLQLDDVFAESLHRM